VSSEDELEAVPSMKNLGAGLLSRGFVSIKPIKQCFIFKTAELRIKALFG